MAAIACVLLISQGDAQVNPPEEAGCELGCANAYWLRQFVPGDPFEDPTAGENF